MSARTRELTGRLDLLALHRTNPFRYPHLLESAAVGPNGRFDLLFAFPGESLRLDRDGGLSLPHGVPAVETDFLQALDQWWHRERLAPADDGLPFTGGWFVYLGYELAARVEPLLRLPPPPQELPVAMATRFPAAVVRDRRTDTITLSAEAESADLLDQMEADIRDLARAQEREPLRMSAATVVMEEPPARRYRAMVERALAYIRDGDVFQANLSRPWRGTLTVPAASHVLYDQVRRHNPAPFCGLATWYEGAIVCSSPERLVEVRDGWIQTRPIAGTRPRGQGPQQDLSFSRELLSNPKERAEHVMLIDLERNDLGRVCIPGTVEVNELMVLESYARVHHIVSNVRGRLRADATPGAVIRAVFPGGTITGCPKVRCMEIIAELEQEGRGPYTGSMGYLNRDGSLDLNILIRTLVRSGNQLELRAGAGIVADSDAERELEETRAKARAVLQALESASL